MFLKCEFPACLQPALVWCLPQLRGACRSLAAPRPPAPPWTPVPLASLVRFPARTHPGYPGAPPRPPSGLPRRCTRLPWAERRPREPASGPHTEAEAEAWPFRAAPAPVSQCFPRTSSEPQPRPCRAHGASPRWASSPPLRPGPLQPGPSLEHLFSHVSRLVLDVLPI